MAFVSDAVRADLRTLEESNMPDTCSISVPGAPTRDAFNEEVAGTPTVTTGIICGYRELSGDERLAGGGVVEIGTHVLRFPAFTVIPSDSTVTVAARGSAPQKVFQVKKDLHSSSEVATRVLATEV